MFDIVRRRYWYFGFSLLVIVPGLIALALWGLPLAIDYTGGTLLEGQFKETPRALEPAQIRQLLAGQVSPASTGQTSGTDIAVTRSKELNEADKQKIITALEAPYGP